MFKIHYVLLECKRGHYVLIELGY